MALSTLELHDIVRECNFYHRTCQSEQVLMVIEDHFGWSCLEVQLLSSKTLMVRMQGTFGLYGLRYKVVLGTSIYARLCTAKLVDCYGDTGS